MLLFMPEISSYIMYQIWIVLQFNCLLGYGLVLVNQHRLMH